MSADAAGAAAAAGRGRDAGGGSAAGLALLLILFFVSGAAALVYQVVWMRSLALIFGGTTLAVSTILAVFMGGLAIGSRLLGRVADRSSHPLRLYAGLEAGIGVYAVVAIPLLFAVLEPIYVFLYRLELPYAVLAGLRAGLGALVLLPPTVAMGGTLPALARFFVERRGEVGRSIALLYFANTLGAVAGTLLAGFLLIETLGIRGTSWLAAASNLGLALGASGLARRMPSSRVPSEPAPGPAGDASAPPPLRLVMGAIALSGFAALAAEVVWTRALVRHLYNSTYAFSTMLAVFLLGIALGSWLYALLPRRWRASLHGFALLQLAIAGAWVLSARLFFDLDALSAALLGDTFGSFRDSLLKMVLGSAAVLLLPALCLGATLPLATEVAVRGTGGAGFGVGRIYAANTLGAVLGSLAAPFVLIASFGMRGTVLAIVGINAALAVVLALAGGRGNARWGTALTGVLLAAGVSWWLPEQLFLRTFAERGRVLFHAEGATDSVAVIEPRTLPGQRVIVYDDLRGTAGTFTYFVNFFLGHLPVLLHPGEPRRALHICFGSGNSLAAMARHPSIERIDSVELSPHVLEAAGYFWTNEGIVRDPKVEMIIDDGRNFALASPATYDVIALEPPEIFTAGVINLYTREFYADLRERLDEHGVVEQWLPIGEASLEDELRLLRSFHDVFPHATVWQQLITEGPLLLIGTKHPLSIDLQRLREKLSHPAIRPDMALLEIEDAETLLSTFLFGEKRLASLLSGVEPVTDDRTYVDFSMPRFLGSGFGMGSMNMAAREGRATPYTVLLERSAHYARLREPVLPYLENLGGVPPAELEARIRSSRRHSIERMIHAIPRDAWRSASGR